MSMAGRLVRGAGMFALAVFFGGMLSLSAAAAYPDMEGHWAAPAVERWAESGVLKGYADGRFGPDDPVDRAQLASILYRIWGCAPKEGHSYADLSSDDWYYESLMTMNAYGIALNQGDHIYPTEELSREEAFYMIAKAFQVGYEGILSDREIKGISDTVQIAPDLRSRISSMFSQGALHGASDGAFHPQDPVSRAEVIQVIDNLVDKYITQPGQYTLSTKEVALVACPGVELTYTPRYKNSLNEARVYLMAPAAAGGTVFRLGEGLERGSVSVSVYGVTETGETVNYRGEGEALTAYNSVRNELLDLSNPKQVPDLRFAGGMGIQRCPYLIETAEQFLLIGETAASVGRNAYYELRSDVELPGEQVPISAGTTRIHLDGRGHTLTYHMGNEAASQADIAPWKFAEQDVGLFGKWFGTCSNLTLAGSIHLTAVEEWVAYLNVGGLAGSISGGSVVNCRSEMEITVRCDSEALEEVDVGGLVGNAKDSNLDGCLAAGRVTGELMRQTGDIQLGGLAGGIGPATYVLEMSKPGEQGSAAGKTTLTGCGATGTFAVKGGYHTMAGGLVGLVSCPSRKLDLEEDAMDSSVEKSWSTAQVSASGAGFQSDCGGIVGQVFAGTIRQCWAKPTISINTQGNWTFQNLGGISGSTPEAEAFIQDCWADVSQCEVKDDDGHYGGITGRMGWSVKNCFALGTEAFGQENGLTYKSWTRGAVEASSDFTAATPAQRTAFLESCGWDFDRVWDKSGACPVLRGCEAEAQRAAQAL